MTQIYKGWTIQPNSAAFWTSDRYVATSPDYDVDYDGGFYPCNGASFVAGDIQELKAMIDDYIDASEESPTNQGSSS
jgi:hypothetical protein